MHTADTKIILRVFTNPTFVRLQSSTMSSSLKRGMDTKTPLMATLD